MKPIKLTMSAFGSYAGKEEIDFSKLENGLFLITGDTGSGKTTIFDAIAYALYDKTSGGKRDGNMMRSQYAEESLDTYVEYLFSYHGKEYLIRRNPEYMRVGKRKMSDGSVRYVKESSKVSLVLPDGKEFKGKKREVDKKIEEIIGLDFNQFTQIAMIAQGDFLKLLHAESKERKKIFSQIFQTRIYWRVQEELKELAKARYIQLEENRRDCQREMERVEIPTLKEEDTRHERVQTIAEEWKALLKLEMPPLKEILDLLDEVVEIGTEWEEQSKECVGELQQSLETLKLKIHQQEEMNRLFTMLEKAEEQAGRLREQELEMNKAREQVDAAVRAEQVSIKERQYLSSMTELKKVEQAIMVLEKWFFEQDESEQVLCKTYEEAKEQWETETPKLQKQIVRLSDMLPRYQRIQRLEADKMQATNGLVQCMNTSRQASEHFENVYQQFLEEQAGILARQLQEGEPCPVCGSHIHPKPAESKVDAPDQQDVEMAKRKRDEAEEKRSKAVEHFQQVKSSLEAEYSQLEGEKFSGGDVGKVKQELSRLQDRQKALQKELERAENLLQRFRDEKTHKKGLLESRQQQSRELQERITLEKDAVCEEMQKQQFVSKEDYEDAKPWIGVRVQQEKILQKYQQDVLQVETMIKTLRQQTEGKEPINLDVEQAQMRMLSEELKEWKSIQMARYSVNEKNKDARTSLRRYAEKKGNIQKEYELLNNLNRTANGTLPGSVKMDFETYVQRKYFKQIIYAANKRLARMTTNEFILQCREVQNLSSQGQAGLDLDVYHLVSDTTRDVKTLSGGESFMAALSMALGLSDMVQNTVGAVHLETMFVDEGFGSLDDASRERAIQILKELAGDKALVGIISHVNELKEQIDWQLRIKKTEKGSHASWNGM